MGYFLAVYLALISLPLLPIALLGCISRCAQCVAHREYRVEPGTWHKVPSRDNFARVEHAATRMRRRIQSAIGMVGWAVFALGIMPRMPGIHVDDFSMLILTSLGCWGVSVLLVMVRPIDANLVAAVSLFCFFMYVCSVLLICSTIVALQGEEAGAAHLEWTAFAAGLAVTCAVAAALLVPCVFCCSCCMMPPRRKLHRLWLAQRVAVAGTGLCHLALSLFYFVYDLVAGPSLHCALISCMARVNESVAGDPLRVDRGAIIETSTEFMYLGLIYVSIALVFTPRCRGCVIRWISSIGTYASRYQEAAAVAALLNARGSIDNVRNTAASLFRVLPLKELTPSDLVTPIETSSTRTTSGTDRPYAELHLSLRTVPAELGSCDAFVSHAWRDNAGQRKFERLRDHAWGIAEPTIWLDQACLEQNRITESMALLPVFLAGCNSFICLPGAYYTSRLWCVLEIFVYLHISASPEAVFVLPLDENDSKLRASLQHVSTADLECSVESDREYLLAVIEATYGQFEPFDRLVRGILHDRLSASQVSV